MLLVIDDKIPFIRGAAERLGRTVYLPGSAISAADVRPADALIVRTRTRCDARLLAGSRIRFVSTATIGYDHIDVPFLRSSGIGWTNCPGCNATSVAQYVECCLAVLAATGKLRLDAATTLGVVGVGHVGSAVAAMARRLGLRLMLCDPLRLAGHGAVTTGDAAACGIRDADCSATLADVAHEADVITFHTPLTSEGPYATHHLASAGFFAALRRRPVFINAARGEVTDTAALIAAKRAGRVGALVVDTWEHEPAISGELLALADIATPHIAGYSADGKATGTRMALEAVARYFHLPADFSDITPPAVGPDFRYDTRTAPAEVEAFPCLALYDPRRDSDALKSAPAAFERLRGGYPLRREHL